MDSGRRGLGYDGPPLFAIALLCCGLNSTVTATLVTAIDGESATARLLIFSRVVLCVQLSFAVLPLVIFTAGPAENGAARGAALPRGLAGVVAAAIAVFNVKPAAGFLPGP
jgi:manganese transport protein